jgi:hypothetical protein
MRRREFIAGLSATAAGPLAAPAQQRVKPVIGFLPTGSPEAAPSLIARFCQGLNETGFIEYVIADLRAAVSTLGFQIELLSPGSNMAFATLQKRADALLTAPSRRRQAAAPKRDRRPTRFERTRCQD